MVKKISVIDVTTNEDDKQDSEEEIEIEKLEEEEKEDEKEEVNIVSFDNPAIDANNIKNGIVTKQKVVEMRECPICGKYITAKTLRYSHQFQCKGRFRQEDEIKKPVKEKPIVVVNEKMKKERLNRQSEYEEMRQTTPKPQIHKVEEETVQPVRMKTMREQKQERYTNMMENTV